MFHEINLPIRVKFSLYSLVRNTLEIANILKYNKIGSKKSEITMELRYVEKFQRRELSSYKMQLFVCLIYSYLQCVDGYWGAQVDAKTNAFNGMIGMIQRQVSNVYLC